MTQGKAWIACCELFFANQPWWATLDAHNITTISSCTKYLAEILLGCGVAQIRVWCGSEGCGVAHLGCCVAQKRAVRLS
jgi:hypothetical protein